MTNNEHPSFFNFVKINYNFFDHSIKEMEPYILRDLGWKKIDKVVFAGKCIDLDKSLTSQYITANDNISGLVFFVTI